MHIAALLGAGFSKWAVDLPIASELFDRKIECCNKREIERLDVFGRVIEKWFAANASGHAEDFIAACHERTRSRAQVNWYVTRRLCEPFIDRIMGGWATYMIDDSRRFRVDGVVRARDFILKVLGKRIRGYITPNYDLLIEYALGTEHFNYGTPGEILQGRGKNPWFFTQGDYPVRARGLTPIAKIHGSLSWTETERFTDGRCGMRGNALIVPPMPPKAMPATLADVWALAETILAGTRDLLVFGFSFHPRDTHVRELLGSAGRGIERVLLIDPFPQVQRAQSVWPNARIEACPPPPDDDGAIMKWRAAGG